MRTLRKVLLVAAFLAPNVIGFLLFTAGPVLAGVVLSFTSWDLLTPPRWVGTTNFVNLLGFYTDIDGSLQARDPDFWKYLYNTVFLLLALPVNIGTSLFLAVVLVKKIRFSNFYRLIFFMPSILAGVSIFYLWRWIFNPNYGLFNALLAAVGVEGPGWLTDPLWVKPALMLMQCWIGVGGTGMILYIAALKSIPAELYEAAQMDGAGPWHEFWAVTWPSVMPITFFLLVMGTIGGLQSGVESVMIMTGGGPNGASTTLGYYIYTKAFVDFEMGYAASISIILFFIILILTLINWKYGGKNVAD
ncbi:MAG TPA: sugar ABC transporter permease [Chthoniobacteraceae bacterium]|nr:sugar ABC transporter permease [Chthoniobacteraceae bacterium]